MNTYVIRFEGLIAVHANNKDEAIELLNDADYGISTLFDNTDDIELQKFVYHYSSFKEV